RARTLDIPAERGQIMDRSGSILVDSRPSIAVVLSPPDLPHSPAQRSRLYARLESVLQIAPTRERCKIAGRGVLRLGPIRCEVAQQLAQLPYQNVTIKKDVPAAVQYYIAERQDQFPGVNVEQIWLRRYPLHTLAAQLFGTIGPINKDEIHERRYRGVSPNAIIGQSGLEWYYDRYLRGTDGAERVQVDALGRFKGDISQKKPTAGHSLKLSLDVSVQR